MITEERLYEALNMYSMKRAERIDEEIKIADINTEFSDKFKIKMNRLYRELLGGKKALHPEVDRCYERIRSRIIYFLFYRRKRL